MQITINIPDEYVPLLEPDPAKFSRCILEAVAVKAYKANRLTSAEV